MFDIKKANFNKIKLFFDKLNFDETHFVNSNDICTPLDCVKEMVDSIPKNFWKKKNLKILDSCCGNWNFHAYISKKTSLKNLYFNEINPIRIKNVKKIFWNNINITEKDFLKFDKNYKYDLIVSNPPYAKFTEWKRTSKNHNMSRDFIKKALDITKKDGYILFIVPNNWMSYADRNKLPELLSKYQFIHLNINGAKKWFPKVGSSFTWFLLQKSPNKKAFKIENHYKIKTIEKAKINMWAKFIPLYYSDNVKNIFNKTINQVKEKYNIETTSFLHRHTKKDFIKNEKDDIFKHKLIHTPSQVVRSKIPHKFQKWYKVFIPLSNQYEPFIDNCWMTQSIAFIRCKNKQHAEKIKKELKNDIYLFLNNLTRYWNFNNVRILQNFPRLNTFSLSKNEKKFIKEFNEVYYNRKA